MLEVMIVVVILGILAMAAIMNYMVAMDKARLASCRHALDNIKNGLEIYTTDNRGYPDSDGVTSMKDVVDLLKGFADFQASNTCEPEISYQSTTSTYRLEAKVRYAGGNSPLGVKLILENGMLSEEPIGPL